MSLVSDTIRCSKSAIQKFRSSGDFDYYSDKATTPTSSGGTGGYGSSLPPDTDMPDIDIPDIDMPSASISPTFGWILAIVVLLAILSLAVYILHKQGFLDKKRKEKEDDDEEASEEQEETADELQITGIDFEDEISKAKANGNWREGIRHVYLKALRNLDEKGIVTWEHEKTPTDYSYEAKLASFTRLTTLFLRVRYGMYDTGETDFLQAEQMLEEVNANVAEAIDATTATSTEEKGGAS